jgi:hypothetical protein
MVNWALDYFSFAATLPGARGKRTTRLKAFRRALRALVAMQRSRSPRRRHRAPQAATHRLAPPRKRLPNFV